MTSSQSRKTVNREVVISFRRPSTLVADAFMDIPIQKPGKPPVGTGPFRPENDQSRTSHVAAQMTAFAGYYGGSPRVDQIAITTYPNVRAAWADMLRDRLDMLYEVGPEAIDTLRGAKNVTVYAFDRPFQYLMFLNTQNPKLHSSAVRKALNEAIDRSLVVRDGLAGHGTPSGGPVSPHHWAYQAAGTTFAYDPQSAAAMIGKPFVLKCLSLSEPPFEQIVLLVKQQLQAIGVDLQIEQVSGEQVATKLAKGDFESLLIDPSTGWSLQRAYRWWHSQGASNLSHYSNQHVDAALDRVRHALGESDYREAVGAFQKAVADDPPAIFLAWSERSRAISTRFDIKSEEGRDVLATLKMWQPRTDNRNAIH